jgi:hypothetical protein
MTTDPVDDAMANIGCDVIALKTIPYYIILTITPSTQSARNTINDTRI